MLGKDPKSSGFQKEASFPGDLGQARAEFESTKETALGLPRNTQGDLVGSDPAVCTWGPRNRDPPEMNGEAWGLDYSKGSLPSSSVHRARENGACFHAVHAKSLFPIQEGTAKRPITLDWFLDIQKLRTEFSGDAYLYISSDMGLKSLWEDLGRAGRPCLLRAGVGPRVQVQNEPEQHSQIWPHI